MSTLFLINNKKIDVEDDPWYKDLIYYLKNKRCPDHFVYTQLRRLHLESSKYLILNNMFFLKFF